ncbi:MAG: hypothetical protein ACWA5R_02410 [bacterium]
MKLSFSCRVLDSRMITGALILMLFQSANATTYYVCNNHPNSAFNGSDANNGTTMNTAWRTFSFAHQNFATLQAGDTLSFCRGGVFQTSSSNGYVFTNQNSTAQQPITISSYSPDLTDVSCLSLPVINDVVGQGVFRFINPSHEEGFIIEELRILGASEQVSNGITLSRDIDFVTIQNVELANLSIGIYIASGGDFSGDSDGLNTDIHINGVYVHDNQHMGFLGKSDRLIIENSVFDNNAYDLPNFGHHIYLSKAVFQNDHENFPFENYDQTIRNNLLYRSAVHDHDNDPSTADECDAVSLVVHGVQRNTLIENNVVWEDEYRADGSCFGIAVIPGYNFEYPEGFAGTRIRNNIVMNMGRESISCNGCDQSVIEDNLILAKSDGITLRAINVGQNENNYFPCQNGQANNPPGCQINHHYDLLDKTNQSIVAKNRIILDTSNGTSNSNPILVGDNDGIADFYTLTDNQSWYAESARIENGQCTTMAATDNNVNDNEFCDSFSVQNKPQQVIQWEQEAFAAITTLPKDQNEFFQTRQVFSACQIDTIFMDGYEVEISKKNRMD